MQHAEVTYQPRSTAAAAALTPAAAPSPASSSSSHAGSQAGSDTAVRLPSARAAEAAAPTQMSAASHAISVPRPRAAGAGGLVRAGGLIMHTHGAENDGLARCVGSAVRAWAHFIGCLGIVKTFVTGSILLSNSYHGVQQAEHRTIREVNLWASFSLARPTWVVHVPARRYRLACSPLGSL